MRAVVQTLVETHTAGLDVTPAKLERAVLQGVDLEKAILALIDARRMGKNHTFEELCNDASGDA